MAYRITITDAAPTDEGLIRFACAIETDVSGTWQPLPAAPAYIQIKAQDVLAVIRRPIADTEKRAELLAVLKTHMRGLPILIAAVTIDQVHTLLPSGWPITVEL